MQAPKAAARERARSPGSSGLSQQVQADAHKGVAQVRKAARGCGNDAGSSQQVQADAHRGVPAQGEKAQKGGAVQREAVGSATAQIVVQRERKAKRGGAVQKEAVQKEAEMGGVAVEGAAAEGEGNVTKESRRLRSKGAGGRVVGGVVGETGETEDDAVNGEIAGDNDTANRVRQEAVHGETAEGGGAGGVIEIEEYEEAAQREGGEAVEANEGVQREGGEAVEAEGGVQESDISEADAAEEGGDENSEGDEELSITAEDGEGPAGCALIWQLLKMR